VVCFPGRPLQVSSTEAQGIATTRGSQKGAFMIMKPNTPTYIDLPWADIDKEVMSRPDIYRQFIRIAFNGHRSKTPHHQSEDVSCANAGQVPRSIQGTYS